MARKKPESCLQLHNWRAEAQDPTVSPLEAGSRENHRANCSSICPMGEACSQQTATEQAMGQETYSPHSSSPSLSFAMALSLLSISPRRFPPAPLGLHTLKHLLWFISNHKVPLSTKPHPRGVLAQRHPTLSAEKGRSPTVAPRGSDRSLKHMTTPLALYDSLNSDGLQSQAKASPLTHSAKPLKIPTQISQNPFPGLAMLAPAVGAELC